jgi:AbrB family looped-hinge helix DNA binding protein
MTTLKAQVKVDKTGRFTIPIAMRRELGLEKGGAVTFEIYNDIITIVPDVSNKYASSMRTLITG